MTANKRAEALDVLEQGLQEVFRVGDKHLPADIRSDANRLWQKVLLARSRAA